MSAIPKLEPMRHFLAQLDSTDYDSRGAMLKAARALRATRKRHLDGLRADDRDFARRQPTMAEKRAKVRAGTHRWCRKCRGRGFLRGKDGVVLKHGECRGDGLVRVGSGGGGGQRGRARARGRPPSRPRPTGRRRHRGKKATAGLAGLGTVWTVLGEMFGTVGQVVALVVIAVVVVVRLLALVLRGVAAVAR